MRQLRTFWRSIFDVRPGEGLRTLFMALYMTCALSAYYILKPVSRALFLNKFDIDQLPYLYILIAFVGGMLAYIYTRVVVGSSLMAAVNRATLIAMASLLAIWWLLRFDFNWMLYVFNVWLSLFSVITVSQGWLVAANVFDSREAKRLYGLIGLSATAGAALGGEITARLAPKLEARDLLLVTAGMVLLSYVFIRLVAAQSKVDISSVSTKAEDEDFAFRDILDGIRRHRHLQVIMAIITITFIVDVMVDFQFSAMAKAAHHGKDLTVFLGSFYGLYMNIATFLMQFFLTALIVRYLGVGGTLQIMPVVIGLASAVMIFVPKLGAASMLRLSEASTRYSFNKTGMELLYLPLPTDLKNRTKAFVDVFMDRFGRGLGAMVLLGYLAVVEKDPKHPNLARVSALILTVSILWILLSVRVSREYLATIRRRLESRRLDFSDARITVTDGTTVTLLEKTITEGTPRQAAYALRLLGDAPDYDAGPLISAMAGRESTECRTAAYEVAAGSGYKALVELATSVLLATTGDAVSSREQQAAAAYLVRVSPGAPLDARWVADAAADILPSRRALAAYVIGLSGPDSDSGILSRLLEDPDAQVASAACRAAGLTGSQACFDKLVRRLGDHAVRGSAIESLALYGASVSGALGQILADKNSSLSIRRQIPRALRLIHDQRSVDVLLDAAGGDDPVIRIAAVKALNRLRESAPQLQFQAFAIGQCIKAQASGCLRLNAQLFTLRTAAKTALPTAPRTAAGLLARTLETRLHQSMEGLFRLLGLRYAPNEIYNTWLALESGQNERMIVAQDYLDSILDRDVKSVIMPLLESPERVASHACESFPLDAGSPEAAIRELLRTGDTWLVSCAIATAGEMKLKGLAVNIAAASENSGQATLLVARHAAAALA